MEGTTSLRKEQDDVYRKAMEEMRKQIAEIDRQTEDEIRRVKAKLSALQENKKSLIAACSGIARIMGESPADGEADAAPLEAQAAGRGPR